MKWVILTLFLMTSALTAQTNLDYSYFKSIGEKNIFNPNRGIISTQIRIPKTNSVSFFLRGTFTENGISWAVFDNKVLKTNDSINGMKITDIQFYHINLLSKSNTIQLNVGSAMIKHEDSDWSLK